ncbi:phosphogluconate dehydratase [Tenacibaculum pacificus]|uniref:phosphogluconate dehydratase n=1 Tax=Tenacibaculum pacificus TaxID=3018314 RepID=UPI0022F3849A|nr:phosphogluconate dehydratase [Tenacibaculum pacificus]WBX73955.1 phosphogluconate dehydratase [Tenacibaculum pacificus]
MNKIISEVTNRIIERSKNSRQLYLTQMQKAFSKEVSRNTLSCGNLAHGFAACSTRVKNELSEYITPNLGIVTAYNDMLSAHKPYENYPQMIREYAEKHTATAQVAGAVPAMCDGVTQGQDGMELSLFSRDIIALSTAIALSHNMFDGVINLGICDKIVPGLIIGSLKFGHLPAIFMPSGPMETGISNDEKAQIRQNFAEGKIDRDELLKGESDSYHSPGTCTFFGTANSNQMLMEIMGLQLPGASFVNPDTQLRKLLDEEAVKIISKNCKEKDFDNTLASIYSEKTVVNGIIGLLATGGSTNHTIHLIAMAKAAGIIINWQDFSDLSGVIPLLARVYPNGSADVNHFHAAGGVGFIVNTLLKNGLLHEDVNTILGKGLSKYTKEPKIENDKIIWVEGSKTTLNENVIRTVETPFSKDGGLKVLKGNIGESVIKTSAVKDEYLIIEAPAVVFLTQEALMDAFKKGELDKDFIAVLPFQGPKSNGMPELHKLTPSLSILQRRGFKVALVTDGRMSGASGKVPAAIHLSPEALDGGVISKIKTGDILSLNAVTGQLNVLNETVVLARKSAKKTIENNQGSGRELFGNIRNIVGSSQDGASFLF